MWRRIALIFTNVVGFLVILGEAGSQYNYSAWAFQHEGKLGEAMSQQHLYYVIMMIVIVLAIMATVNYVLRKKPK